MEYIKFKLIKRSYFLKLENTERLKLAYKLIYLYAENCLIPNSFNFDQNTLGGKIDRLEAWSGNLNDKFAYCIDRLDEIYCKNFSLLNKYVSPKRFSKPWVTPRFPELPATGPGARVFACAEGRIIGVIRLPNNI